MTDVTPAEFEAAYRDACRDGCVDVIAGRIVNTNRKSAASVTAEKLSMTNYAMRKMVDLLRPTWVAEPLPERPAKAAPYEPVAWTYPREINLALRNATVMVAGDLHFWPLARVPLSPIKAAFRAVSHEIKPDAIVFNGDLIDGTRISKHPVMRNQNPPKPIDEIVAASDFLLSLYDAAHKIVTMSNHDVRVDNYIANQASELEDICPRLIDRLPGWVMSYGAVINQDVEIRHETGRGGIHARYNNAKDMGRTIVTGHTHQLGVTPVYTRGGVHYGIECGMLAHPFEPQFEYTWNRPTRWQPGFIVLTFDDEGRLLPPEMCEWIDGRAIFRGRVIEAEQRYRVKATTQRDAV